MRTTLVGDGRVFGNGRVFGYARGQGAVTAGLAFVCLVETFTMSVLLRGWPAVHAVVLFLHVSAVVVLVGRYAGCRVRPHLLDGDGLRVRHAVHVDLRIPLERIAAVRHEPRSTHARAERELHLPVGSQTSVTLELTTPLLHVGLLGRRRREVDVVRLHADDPRDLVRALRQALGQAVGEAAEGARAGSAGR
ncbi:hypothetical protein [Streptomyces sp. NPDC002328]|uniref:hypothetical protein n=1 Tax=Streptomyces sp. NPDC002328 TaxID=3364642 RepID=UPI00369F85F5